MEDLTKQQQKLLELRSSCTNLETFDEVKDLAAELNSSLALLDTEFSSAKNLTEDRLKTLQVQINESMKKPEARKYLLKEVFNSPSFIFHLFATFLLLTALAKLNNLLTG